MKALTMNLDYFGFSSELVQKIFLIKDQSKEN